MLYAHHSRLTQFHSQTTKLMLYPCNSYIHNKNDSYHICLHDIKFYTTTLTPYLFLMIDLYIAKIEVIYKT